MFKAMIQTALPAFSPCTLNLASPAGLKVSPLHARVRLVPCFFFVQRRSTATSVPNIQAMNIKSSWRETDRRCGNTLEGLVGHAWVLLGGKLLQLCWLLKSDRIARETDTLDTADSADAKDKTAPHLWKMPPLCCRPLLCCPSNTWCKREHDTMWWRLRSQEKGCWFKQITVL